MARVNLADSAITLCEQDGYALHGNPSDDQVDLEQHSLREGRSAPLLGAGSPARWPLVRRVGSHRRAMPRSPWPVASGPWSGRACAPCLEAFLQGPIDRSDPRERVGWKCTSQPSPCHARHGNRGVAPVTTAGPGLAPSPRRPRHNRKAANHLRNRPCAHLKRVSVHIDSNVTCALWTGPGRLENRLQGTAPCPRSGSTSVAGEASFSARFPEGPHAPRCPRLAQTTSLRDVAGRQIVRSIIGGIE